MNTYRSLWLGLSVPLAAVGAAVGLVRSPVPVALLFLIFGAVGGLLTVSCLDGFWEHPTRGRLLLAAVGGFVAGTSVGAFIGYASLLGPGVFMFAAVIVATSPYSVTACACSIRSFRDPAATTWLAEGPEAADSPLPYLAGGHPHDAPAVRLGRPDSQAALRDGIRMPVREGGRG